MTTPGKAGRLSMPSKSTANRTPREQWLDLSVGKADLIEISPELLRQAQQERVPLIVTSRPTELLAVAISDQQIPDPHLRQSIALALDRAALCNVIYQKQGEITASLLPDALSGYSFLIFDGAESRPVARTSRGAVNATSPQRRHHECHPAISGGTARTEPP